VEAAIEKSVSRNVKRTKNAALYRGPVKTVKFLLDRPEPPGFTDLVRAGKSDLTVEALILQAKWKPLFTQTELDTAAKRLSDGEKKKSLSITI
jgi:hypothetical protein